MWTSRARHLRVWSKIIYSLYIFFALMSGVIKLLCTPSSSNRLQASKLPPIIVRFGSLFADVILIFFQKLALVMAVEGNVSNAEGDFLSSSARCLDLNRRSMGMFEKLTEN